MKESSSITVLTQADIPALIELTKGHVSETGYFEQSWTEQQEGKRRVFLAWEQENLAGYVHLNRLPKYFPFRHLGIPEIQDLFVHTYFRRQGIGEALVKACEEEALSSQATTIGIGVGVTKNFGAAQRLYIRLGYLPDGSGVVFERENLSNGEMRPIDDRLCLMLMKDLNPALTTGESSNQPPLRG
ncbi:MAG: GNAT family N-acetyltransferase [Alphaproteobacteria bacterium]|jgi:ribosomal protein S18 acetylase RimI-like enzyme|nr:GNAT family N-acetyltransferase [Alphaproteobacteria bacterium]